MTEEELVGWHHQHKEHEFKQAPGDVEGHGILSCCSPWGRTEVDTTEQLEKNNELCSMGNIISNYIASLYDDIS